MGGQITAKYSAFVAQTDLVVSRPHVNNAVYEIFAVIDLLFCNRVDAFNLPLQPTFRQLQLLRPYSPVVLCCQGVPPLRSLSFLEEALYKCGVLHHICS